MGKGVDNPHELRFPLVGQRLGEVGLERFAELERIGKGAVGSRVVDNANAFP